MEPLIYEHTDIPPGVTCDEYRRARRAPARRRHLRLPRLRSLLGL